MVLWVRHDDPPSERAKLVAGGLERLLPPGVCLHVVQVDEDRPDVPRVPCLQFRSGDRVVYALEGDLTIDRVINALRKLG